MDKFIHYIREKVRVLAIGLVAVFFMLLAGFGGSFFIDSTRIDSYAATASGNWSDYASDKFSGGDGYKDTPYLISSAEEFAYLANQINSGNTTLNNGMYYKFVKPIDLSAHNWIPIGTETNRFSGNIDCNNQPILGLRIINKEKNGLFGYVNNLTISKIIIINASVTANSGNLGIIAGEVNGKGITIENAQVSGTITHYRTCPNTNDAVGGLIGSVKSGSVSITNTHANTTIKLANSVSTNCVAGFVGYSAVTPTITNSYSVHTINYKKSNSESDSISEKVKTSTTTDSDWFTYTGLNDGLPLLRSQYWISNTNKVSSPNWTDFSTGSSDLVCQAKKYTISATISKTNNTTKSGFKFDTEYRTGGNEAVEGEQIKLTASTSEIGYQLKGFTVNGTEKSTSSPYVHTMPAEDTEFVAVFEPKTYTVTFDPNGGSVSTSSKTVTYDSTYGDLPTATKSGYTFAGWKPSSGVVDEIGTTSNLLSGTFVGGSNNFVVLGENDTTYKYTDKISIRLLAYMDNWSLYTGSGNESGDMRLISCTEGGGWNLQSDNDLIDFLVYDAGASMYRRARGTTKWSDLTSGWHEFIMTFDGSYTRLFIDGEKIGQSDQFTGKIGYNSANRIFVGAEASGSATTPYGQYFTGEIAYVTIENTSGPTGSKFTYTNKCASNETLTANWTVNTYSISYTLNGGTVSTANPASYTVETATFKLNNPTKTGYTFAGWTGSNGTTAQTSVSIAKGSTGNKNYTANWTANTYTVTFDKNGGGTPSPETKTVTYDSTYGTLATISRTGYTFNGWYTAASGGTKVELSTKVTITEAQTLYAHWTVNTYTVTFDKNGGSTPSPTSKTVTYDSTYGTLATITRTGYTFNGWYTAASGGTEIKTDTTVLTASDHTLYAQWKENASYLYNDWQTLIAEDLLGSTVEKVNPKINSITFTSTNPTGTGFSVGATDEGTSKSDSQTVHGGIYSGCYDVEAYVETTTISSTTYYNITFYSPYTIYAPVYSHTLFSNESYPLTGITSFSFANFNTAKVTNMYGMFYGCADLGSIDVSSFNTSNVTSMSHMFKDCSSLGDIDTTSFITSNVNDVSYMFYGCTSLTSVKIKINSNKTIASANSMFSNCSELTSLNLSNYDMSETENIGFMFSGCSKLTSITFGSETKTSLTNMYETFSGCSKLSTINLSTFNISSVARFYGTFKDCSSLTSVTFGSYEASSATSVAYMFYGCSSLKSVNLEKITFTSKLKLMNYMLYGCKALTSIDLSKFNTSNVTTMSYMFYNCSALTSLNVSGFKTTNVTDMSNMFFGCSGLTSLDLSGFDTSKVTDVSRMFSNCSGFESLNLSSFKLSAVTSGNTSGIFTGMTKLKVLNTPYSCAQSISLPTTYTYYSTASTSGKVTSIGTGLSYSQELRAGFTVTFNANGGSVSTSSIIVRWGKTYGEAGALPTPTREHYNFAGWYTAASGGSKVASTTTVSITAAQTLYAHWTIKTYSISTSVVDGKIYSTSYTKNNDEDTAYVKIGGATYYTTNTASSTCTGGNSIDIYAWVKSYAAAYRKVIVIEITGDFDYTTPTFDGGEVVDRCGYEKSGSVLTVKLYSWTGVAITYPKTYVSFTITPKSNISIQAYIAKSVHMDNYV